MTDIEKAKSKLLSGGYTCVLVKGDNVITSDLRGVAPLLGLLDERGELHGFSAADKTVGMGAAYLYSTLGVAHVWANVMSEGAEKILDRAKITHGCGLTVPVIINRRGDGPCPIEAVLSPEDSTVQAVEKIRTRLAELNRAD